MSDSQPVIHMVGSIPLEDAETVFRTLGATKALADVSEAMFWLDVSVASPADVMCPVKVVGAASLLASC